MENMAGKSKASNVLYRKDAPVARQSTDPPRKETYQDAGRRQAKQIPAVSTQEKMENARSSIPRGVKRDIKTGLEGKWPPQLRVIWSRIVGMA